MYDPRVSHERHWGRVKRPQEALRLAQVPDQEEAR